MITVAVYINGAPVYTRSARNTGHLDELGRHVYVVDDGSRISHFRAQGAEVLGQLLLQTVKTVNREKGDHVD